MATSGLTINQWCQVLNSPINHLQRVPSLLAIDEQDAPPTTQAPRTNHDAHFTMQEVGMNNDGLPADFLDAMDRHWQDAELLRSSERLANADHLYGLSAECGLKALLKQDGNRIEGRTHRHIDRLWGECGSLAEGRAGSTSDFNPDANPFDDWRISDRYAHREEIISSRELQRHRSGAEQVRSMIERRNGMP